MATSEQSSASIGSIPTTDGPLCHCALPSSLTISWSDDNPGRRYYKCDIHGFVVWHDKERSCGWQKKSLLEARDKILTQTEEIKALSAALRQANTQIVALEVSHSSASVNETMRSIKIRVTEHINETQRMLRKFVGYSGAGFALATALIVFVIKK
ncbi:hypothetical protein Bca4012_037154 [Brassica carinata]|uniref:DUF7900 domain-containing protein n=1 Tax=Brassica carinata TaxID=52824 RepID=A0A8X7WE61_BRACI|nr:hypothetical protein Bca52824_010844 [Brassica carinata]